MATAVDNQYLLSKLAIGDVASNELCTHSGCLKTLNSNYLRIKNNSSRPDRNTDWVKAIALNKVIEHMYDTNQNFPRTIFKVKGLELIYLIALSKTIADFYWDHFKTPDSFIKQVGSIITPIQNEVFKHENKFEGFFDEDSQIKSVDPYQFSHGWE